MNFEEEYPSLHLKTWIIGLETDVKSGTIYGQRSFLKRDDSGKYVKTSDVINNCIDKQRVREVLKKHLTAEYEGCLAVYPEYHLILEELDLDD